MIEALTLFAILGIFAGLVAGLFGVGGGIITVPFFVAFFIQFGFEEEIIIHMAVGTSLGCIVFTGISSAYAHSKKNAISYNFLKPLASGIVIGAFLGALFAVQLNGNLLKTIIGIFALLIAILMSVSRDIKLKPRNQTSKEPYFVGSGIGFFSSILGIGGGIFSVPYLKASGLPMTSSVGTSAACGIPIAVFGALGYLISGVDNILLPPFALGYIYLPAVIGISLTSILAAKYGANIAHHVSEKNIKENDGMYDVSYIYLYGFFMIVELSDFFNNPSLIEIGPLKIQYYAVTWLLSAIFIYLFLKSNQIMIELGLNHEKVNDLVFMYGLFIGSMCGGRFGYMVFYGTEQLISNPLSLFYIWQGGLSFHGGLVGVVISFLVFSKRNNLSFLRLMDGAALAMPIGLGLVRIGNFLNGELYGKETNGDWGFIFPTDPFGLLRHPSQLYESFGEGILLFILLYWINKLTKIHGVVCSSFLILYGLIRFIIEFFRQPDSHIGYVFLESLSMGQILCVPMIAIGFIMLFYSRKTS